MYRQGDLLLIREERGLDALYEPTVVASRIVQEGEATGHAHRLEGGGDVYNQGTYVTSDGTATLVHDEHDTIELPEGTYRVLRQREYQEDGGWANVWD